MRKIVAFGMAALMALMAFTVFSPTAAAEIIEVTQNYGDVTLSGGFPTGHFDEVWDLTAGDMVISFTYDANGLVDDFGGAAHAWAELGIRQIGYGDFNPTWMVEGAGVWLATDYDWAANTFDPDPPGLPVQDIDDKMILQKGGGQGEGNYNLPSAPLNPWANHAVWFDRDGVNQWQAQMWGAIDGVTYNTGGTYDIIITLHADSASSGTAYMTINGEPQGFYVPNWHSGPADLMPAGMTFTGDMTQMQVFYGLYGYGAIHTIDFNQITVHGWRQQTIDDLIGQKDSIDNLHHGIKNSLNAKLSNAKTALELGLDDDAVNILNAFVNEVEAQRDKKITGDDADAMIAIANDLIVSIGT